MARSKYAFRYLLGGLLVILVAQPLLRYMGLEGGSFGSFLTSSLFIGLLVAALPAVGVTRTRLAVAGGAAAVSLVLVTLLLFGGARTEFVEVPFLLILVLFLLYVVGVTFQYLFRRNRVTVDTIIAALCVYLLIGVVWSFLYSLVDTLEPGSFRSAVFDEGVPFMQLHQNTFYPLYYSFVTLTTLGYGDVVPVTHAAATLAVLEAIAGQIYLAVLVARLVGLHVAHSPPADEDAR